MPTDQPSPKADPLASLRAALTAEPTLDDAISAAAATGGRPFSPLDKGSNVTLPHSWAGFNLAELVNAPYGRAAQEIRKRDPLWASPSWQAALRKAEDSRGFVDADDALYVIWLAFPHDGDLQERIFERLKNSAGIYFPQPAATIESVLIEAGAQ